jgi:O-antigen/teichoic acid export membrane protein
MVKISQKLKDLSTISIVDFSATGISTGFWLYVASMLGPSEYGEISFFLAIAQLASGISLLGASNTLIVYTAKNVKIQSTLYLLAIISGVISSIIIFLFFYNIGTSFLILGYVIFSLVTSELIGRKLFKSFAKFVITQRILMVIFALGFYYLLGNEGIIIGISLSFAPYVVSIIKGFKKYKIDFSLVRNRFKFIMNSYFERLSTIFSTSLDKIIIAPFFGYMLLGNYSLGMQFLMLIMIVPQIVGKYILPQDSIGIENKKLKKIIILISIGIGFLGSIFGPMIISSIFPKFLETEGIIQILSFAVIPFTIVMTYNSKFLGNEKSHRVFQGSLVLTITQIIGIICLGQLFDVIGISIAIVLGHSMTAIFVVIIDKIDSRSG